MDARFLRNVLLKGLSLFLALDLLVAALPAGWGRLSLYNHLFPGRLRLPFGENSSQAYNLSLYDLDAMFASHLLAAGSKPADEYRILIVGDSSVWGMLLRPEETLAGRLDAAGLSLCGKTARVYNLGYPTKSLTKDLLLLDYALRYRPDLIIWSVTLEAFPNENQLTSPLVANNAARVDKLIARYDLPLDPRDPALVRPSFWDRTLIGRRRALADGLRLQLYGVLWAATGIDQFYPSAYQPARRDFDADETFHGMSPPVLDEAQLAFGVLEAGLRAAGQTPVILMNEPILISAGRNSDLRYNHFYPRWAYDQYRQRMAARAQANGWNYLDFWNLLPEDQFTDTAVHRSAAGEALLAARLEEVILQQRCP